MRVDIQLMKPHKSTRIQVYDEIRTFFREHSRVPPRIIREESTETLLPLRTLGEYDVDFLLDFVQTLIRLLHWKYVERVSVK